MSESDNDSKEAVIATKHVKPVHKMSRTLCDVNGIVVRVLASCSCGRRFKYIDKYYSFVMVMDDNTLTQPPIMFSSSSN